MNLNEINICPVKTGDKPIINIHISPKCNMRCKYCFETKHSMKLVPIEDIVDKVNILLTTMNETSYVDFYGSEISVELGKLKYILAHIDKSKVESFTFMTNLLENVNELLEAIGDNGNIITVSLDIGQKLNDVNRVDKFGNPTYRRVLKNIKDVTDNGKIVRLSTTYDTENTEVTEDQFNEFINDVSESGVKTVSLNFINKLNYTDDEVNKIHNLMGYILNYYSIQRESYLNIKIKSEFNLGNLEESILSKTFASCPARKSFTITGDGFLSHCLYQVCDEKIFKHKNICYLRSIYDIPLDKRSLIKDTITTLKCNSCHLLKVCRNCCLTMNLENDGCIEARKSLAKEILWLYSKTLDLPHINDICSKLSYNTFHNKEYTKQIIKNTKMQINRIMEVECTK